MSGSTIWDSRAVLSNIMDILTVFGRGDLKTELIKELERHSANLGRLTETPNVDHSQLKNILHWLNRLRLVLHEKDGQLGQELRDSEFISAIRQRSSIPGGTCDFDLPSYHQWLHLPHERRQADLEQWLGSLESVRQSIELILKLVRNSAEPVQVVASGGLYQHTLDPAIPFQLVRIALPSDSPYFAEVSGGKHRFAVRCLESHPPERPKQASEDVPLRLTCCAL